MSRLLIVLVTYCPCDAIVLVTLIVVVTLLFSNTISTVSQMDCFWDLWRLTIVVSPMDTRIKSEDGVLG